VFVGLLTKLLGKKEEVSNQPVELRTEADIQEWLVTRIAGIAEIPLEEVDMDRPFAEFGMDSMQLFELSGDLQKFLGHEVSEIVAWDYPTIAKLASYLSSPESLVPASESVVTEELAGMTLDPQATEPQQ
jgi:acyl carrier protein